MSKQKRSLLVCGYFRTSQHILFMYIPSVVIDICVQYFQSSSLFGYGLNRHSELGIKGGEVVPKFVCLSDNPYFNENEIVNVSYGSYFLFYQTQSKEIFCAGCNNYGQLSTFAGKQMGKSFSDVENISRFEQFHNGMDVELISNGIFSSHCFMQLKNGDIFGFGSNDYGVLGIGCKSNREPIPKKLDRQLIFSSISLRAKQICCGYSFSLFLMEDGTVYTCGRNDYGQLGRGSRSSLSEDRTPQKVQKLPIIEYISCGFAQIMCITMDGDVYSWGSNNDGELGLGVEVTSNNSRYEPHLISFFTDRKIKIKKISCGSAHTCCITTNDKIYCYGYNAFGQIGNGNNESVGLPFIPEELKDIRCLDVVCGNFHTVCLTFDHEIMIFGRNDNSYFNESDAHNKHVSIPQKLKIYAEKGLPESCTIFKIVAGYDITLVFTN